LRDGKSWSPDLLARPLAMEDRREERLPYYLLFNAILAGEGESASRGANDDCQKQNLTAGRVVQIEHLPSAMV